MKGCRNGPASAPSPALQQEAARPMMPLTDEQIAAVRRRLWESDLGRWRPRVERGV